MKKIFIFIIFILGLSSCRKPIDKEVFVSSYHLSYLDNEYVLTLNTLDNEKSSIGIFKNTSLLGCFNDSLNSLDVIINYSYLKSVILDETVLNKNTIDNWILFIKDSNILEFNFYVFASNEDPSNIYSQSDLLNSQYFYNLYNDPTGSQELYQASKSLHFLEFVREYLNDYESVIIPNISIKEIWEDDKIKYSYLSDGVYIFKDFFKKLNINDHPGLRLFQMSNDLSINEIEYSFSISSYKLKLNNKLRLMIKGTLNMLYGNVKPNEYIYKILKDLLDYCYSNDIDILKINDINYRFNKSYKYEDLKIVIDI